MIARNLISDKYPAVSCENQVGDVLLMMDENSVDVLPLVQDGFFHGFVHRRDLVEFSEDQLLNTEMADPEVPKVQEEEDYLTLLHRFSEGRAGQIAVLNGDTYHGTSTPEVCALALAGTLTASQKGGFILFTVRPIDFSVSELARIAESEGALISGLWIESLNSTGQYVVFMKLDTPYISTIADIMGYEGITILFRSSRMPDEMISERYIGLMKYLDI